jgi:hypothetical protein
MTSLAACLLIAAIAVAIVWIADRRVVSLHGQGVLVATGLLILVFAAIVAAVAGIRDLPEWPR